MKLLDVSLPWPPSVNHYWGARGHGRYLSPHARAWHKEAWAVLQAKKKHFAGEVALYVFAYPPTGAGGTWTTSLRPSRTIWCGLGCLRTTTKWLNCTSSAAHRSGQGR